MLWPFAPVFILSEDGVAGPDGGHASPDLLLNAYYDMAFQWYQLGNYLGYAPLDRPWAVDASQCPLVTLVKRGHS